MSTLCVLFMQLGLPLKLRNLPSGLPVVQSAAHSEEAVCRHISQLVTPLASPRSSALDVSLGPAITATDVAKWVWICLLLFISWPFLHGMPLDETSKIFSCSSSLSQVFIHQPSSCPWALAHCWDKGVPLQGRWTGRSALLPQLLPHCHKRLMTLPTNLKCWSHTFITLFCSIRFNYLNSFSSVWISLSLVSTADLFCLTISSSEIDALIVAAPSDRMPDLGSRKYLNSWGQVIGGQWHACSDLSLAYCMWWLQSSWTHNLN